MLITGQPPLHLTYCLNIHPGETWAESFQAIRQHALAVRASVAPDQPFGLGLRLSHRAAEELAQPAALAIFRRFLNDHALYVFTINGFPYGAFHNTHVKTEVYRPDWRAAERRDYTIRLASILADLLPEGVDGSISTVPCSYKAWIQSENDVTAMVGNLTEVVAHLDELRRRTGREIHLGLEPEPDCTLETTTEAITFFEGPLAGQGEPGLAQRLGCSRAEAAAIIRRHLGICFDTCHLAIQFESLDASLRRLEAHGIRVSKIQLSAAIRLAADPPSLRRLEAFVDPVYLHQVKRRNELGVISAFSDLPEALASSPAGADASAEWRVHFHVPLYFEGDAELGTTAAQLDKAFFDAVRRGRISHLEIETYTFHVLPPSLRSADVATSIIREYEWVLPRLNAATS